MDSHIQNSTIPIRVLIRDTEKRPGIVDKMQSKKSLPPVLLANLYVQSVFNKLSSYSSILR